MKEFQAAHAPLKANGVAEADTQAAVAEALTEEQDPVDIGRKLFNLGAKAFDRHKFGHAYAFFTRAGELTDRPGIVFSRAQSLRKLGGRREEAVALYEQYLADRRGHARRRRHRRARRAAARPRRPATRPSTRPPRRGSSTRAARCSRRTTTPTPTTSSRRPASSPTAPGSCSRARSRCGGSAAAARRRSRSTSNTSPRAAAPATPTPAPRWPSCARREPSGDEDVDTATAKGIFNKGGARFEAGDYGHAYDEFTRASELADRPGILFSRAQALRKLGGREDEAMALYQQYIDLGEGTRLEDASRCSSCCARTAPPRAEA